ncbi:MAG: hypothetical protein KDE31_38380, partial [Caldilineaceae bacterium]|nr:hypothetical protein [Caldilineaceae bacterium]
MIDLLDLLTERIITELNFFASGLGLLTIGAIAVLIILLWDWRIALLGLIAIQVGVIVLVTKVYQLSLLWGDVQILVVTFAA